MKTHLIPAAMLALLSTAASAQQTLIDSMNVSATVTAACSALSTTDLVFGAMGQVDQSQDTTATVSVTCDNGTAFTIDLDDGISGPGQGATGRQVAGVGSGETMDYEIFQPAANGSAATTTHWGAGAQSVGGTGTGAVQDFIATGRLFRTSGSSPGDYTDLVTVTLNF